MTLVNESTNDIILNEHEKPKAVIEKEENMSLNIISNNISLEHNRKRHIFQSSESDTPTSPNQTSNEPDPKIESSLTNDEKSSSQPHKKVSLNMKSYHPHVNPVIICSLWILEN